MDGPEIVRYEIGVVYIEGGPIDKIVSRLNYLDRRLRPSYFLCEPIVPHIEYIPTGGSPEIEAWVAEESGSASE